MRHRAETELPIGLTTRIRFNPTLNSIWFGGVMELINNVAMLSVILTGAALIREREHGTLEHLLVMPIASSVPLFLFGAVLLLFSTTSLGILLGTVARSMPQLGLLVILVVLSLQMLSGSYTPYESMPETVQAVMLFSPTTHFVSIAQAILFRGAGFDVVWPEFVAVISSGVVFFLIALALFRRSVTVSQD